MKELLVPRNIDRRQEKLRQRNLKFLQQEFIECETIYLNGNWNFEENEVKVRKMQCNVVLEDYMGCVPKWLKNVIVDGDFNYTLCDLISLEGCPKIIKGSFNCNYNPLLSLEGSPDYVGGHFVCSSDKLISFDGCPLFIGGNFRCENVIAKHVLTEKDIPLTTTLIGSFKMNGGIYVPKI